MNEPQSPISYDEFGRRFFALAITEERVLAGVNTMAGKPIDVGPIGVGPGKLAKVTAKGHIGEATARPVPGESVSYRVILPVHIAFEVHLQLDTHRFTADLEVPIILTALAAAELRIYIDAAAPLPNQVKVHLKAEGLRASLMSRLVGVEGELQRFVAKYVKRELTKPEIMKARTIDVLDRVDSAWSPEPKDEPVMIADLGAALAAEFEARAELLDPNAGETPA